MLFGILRARTNYTFTKTLSVALPHNEGGIMSTKSNKKLMPLLLALLTLPILVGCGTEIPAGHRGVFYARFGGGTQYGAAHSEGFAWHLPWNRMNVYSTQIQERKETLNVLSSDGASIRLEVSILFRPEALRLDSLHTQIGTNYYGQIVAPNLRSIARGVAGKFTPEEIYSTKRDEMATEILTELSQKVVVNWINIQTVLIRDVTIPAKISEAINFKLAAQQEAQKMEFTIQKEELEAQRKKIEAKGIAAFQKIIASGITPSYLKWKGIEATMEIAKSPNSKVIVIGNSSGDLPIILSADR